ncbi:hypothetical protein [Silvibacterium sp.]|uniref:hypothetical protein n=1 Tax=Silvibacterium sp. TaxID=1964179 RepID=UPI0039E4F2D3
MPARSALFALLLIAPVSCTAFAQQLSVAEAQQRLLHLKAEDMDTDVPSTIQSAITAFKTALTAQTDAVLSRLPLHAGADVAQRQLNATMPTPSVGKMPDTKPTSDATSNAPEAGAYGGELQISVSQPQPSLLLAEESFNIACGDDTVLLAYSNTGGAWRRILTWQSKPYDQISGAFGDTYEARLLHPQRNGHPLVLVVHGTPWCTSTMSSFHMDVLELGAPQSSQPIWHADHGYRRLDLDPPLTLKLTADGFEIRTSVESSADRISRKGVMRYAVVDAQVHRVEPIAMNAHDSVEEWLQMPRSEAAEFADDTPGSLAWKMFQDFTYEGKPKNANIALSTVGAVRTCREAKDHYQAEVTSEIFDPTGKEKEKPGPAYFVQLGEVPNGYRIHSVTLHPDPTCSGADIMGGGS